VSFRSRRVEVAVVAKPLALRCLQVEEHRVRSALASSSKPTYILTLSYLSLHSETNIMVRRVFGPSKSRSLTPSPFATSRSAPMPIP
jgi:hypothetical protein